MNKAIKWAHMTQYTQNNTKPHSKHKNAVRGNYGLNLAIPIPSSKRFRKGWFECMSFIRWLEDLTLRIICQKH